MKWLIGIYLVVVVCVLPVNAQEEYTYGFVDMDNLQLFLADWLDPVDMGDFAACFAPYWLTDPNHKPASAYWEMEETGGSFVYDSTDNAYDLEPASGFDISASTRAARIGRGFKFIDDNDRLILPGLDTGDPAAILDIWPDAVTIMGWVRPMPGGGSDDIWFSKLQTDTSPTVPNTHSELYLRVGNTFYVNGRFGSLSVQTKLQSGVTAEDDVWYHYAFTWDADGMALYIDGELTDTDDTVDIASFIDHDPDNGGYPLTIGAGWVHVFAFTGMIDDVRVYDSALSAARIKCIYDSTPPVVMYDLTVNSGTGSGAYLNEVVVDIAADAPPVGQVFDAWTGDTATVANITDPTTTVTMPAAAVTVTATYKVAPTYTLTVEGGTGSGEFAEGQIVDIVANAPAEGYVFDVWVGDTENVADVNSQATTITMPGQAATVTATYVLATDKLLAWWEMEETEGTVAYDSSGNGNHLEPAGPIVTIEDANTPDGKFGNAFVISGDGGRFEHATLLDELSSNGITIAGWVKPDATDMTASMCWFSKQNGPGNSNQLWLKFNMSSGVPGVIGVSGRGGSTGSSYFNTNSTITWIDDTWYHFAFTWDSSGMNLYVNGEPAANNGTSIMKDGTGLNMCIGTGGITSQKFKGTVDDVRIYEAVLSAQQIQDLYNWVP